MDSLDSNDDRVEQDPLLYRIGKPGDEYGFRSIKEEDLPILLEWRNSPHVSNMMFTDHIISWEEHRAWFEKVRTAQPATHLMFVYNGEPVGYMAYNNIDWGEMSCSPGSYIGDLTKVPITAGKALSLLGGEYAATILKITLFHIYIRVQNKRLIKSFQHRGYAPVEYIKNYFFKNGKYHDVVYFKTSPVDYY